MNNDKTYFTLIVNFNAGYVAGSGLRYNVNLLSLLSQNYYKYNAFNIKLEGMPSGYNNGGTGTNCIHLRGLHWINGYDTISPNYSESRVLEIINGGIVNFTSNCNAIGFHRPSTPSVTLEFFFTDMTGNFIDRITNISLSLIFSITGIDAYKVVNPSKGLRYDFQSKNTSTFNLHYYDGESIDPIDATSTKGRARLFSNINLRSIIGSDKYDKYKKFALIIRRVSSRALNYNNLSTYISTAGVWTTYWMSSNNINFEFPSYTNQGNLTTPATEHLGEPILLGYNSTFTDSYIQYTFIRPSNDITNFVIVTSLINSQYLAGANTTNNELFPDVLFNFEIIPVEDV